MSVLFRGAPTSANVERRDWLGIPGAVSPRTQGTSYVYHELDGLRIAAVVACIGLRAGAFAQLPLKGYKDRNGIAVQLDPQPELFRNPSDNVVPSVWKTQMSISRDLWGYALGRVVGFDASFYPTRVEWIDPSKVKPTVRGAVIEWRIDGMGLVDSSDLVHVPSRWVLPGDPVGISPLEYSGLTDLARKAQDFGRDWFTNGAVPSSILYSDQVLTAEQSDGIVDTILRKWQSRRPAVLGTGLKYEAISVAANESQFLETCNKAAADIAVSFNLPPVKIGAAIAGHHITYANRDQDRSEYLADSINPDLVVIQESLDRHTPRGQYSKFVTAAFLRSDLLTRYQAYDIAINAGIMVPNEARALEEMGPIPGGDVARQSPTHVAIPIGGAPA